MSVEEYSRLVTAHFARIHMMITAFLLTRRVYWWSDHSTICKRGIPLPPRWREESYNTLCGGSGRRETVSPTDKRATHAREQKMGRLRFILRTLNMPYSSKYRRELKQIRWCNRGHSLRPLLSLWLLKAIHRFETSVKSTVTKTYTQIQRRI